MLFRRGYLYVAGYDNPALVSDRRLEREIERLGFSVVWHGPCDDIALPFAVPPHAGTCGDRWDYVAAVVRVAPSARLEVPQRVKFLVAVPPVNPPAPGPAELPPPQVPGGPPAIGPPPAPPAPAVELVKGQDDKRRALHIASEAAAIAVVAPLTWYASGLVPAGPVRWSLRAVAVATVLIDGYLLTSYLTR